MKRQERQAIDRNIRMEEEMIMRQRKRAEEEEFKQIKRERVALGQERTTRIQREVVDDYNKRLQDLYLPS